MNVLVPCGAVALLTAGVLAALSLDCGRFFFAIIAPYTAIVVFLAGFVWKVLRWASSPVPFRIPATCGQQRSLRGISPSRLDNPSGVAGVIGRMLLEVLFFRSLFRNTKAEIHHESKIAFGSNKWLWVGAITFHWSFLIILLRHLRFFTVPVPSWVGFLHGADGVFEIGIPVLYITDILFLAALSYLFVRRIAVLRVRIISLAADYFPLVLISAIAVTGVLMRYFVKVDLVAVKALMLGLIHFNPSAPAGLGAMFYLHLFYVCTLAAYFPFSKLMHMPGVFLSPTRNLANNSRAKYHSNPWNYPVKVHTYEEWEEEFHDKLKAAGYQLERE